MERKTVRMILFLFLFVFLCLSFLPLLYNIRDTSSGKDSSCMRTWAKSGKVGCFFLCSILWEQHTQINEGELAIIL